jgi:uncharacterized membrane protein
MTEARARETEYPIDGAFWGPTERRFWSGRSAIVVLTAVVLAGAVVITLLGVILLWPRGQTIHTQFGPIKTSAALVQGVAAERCPQLGAPRCDRITIKLLGGPRSGSTTDFTIAGGSSIALHRGDHIRVYENKVPANAVTADGRKIDRYGFADFDRRVPMLWLAIAFIGLLLLSGRLHGVRALLGLAGSLLIVVEFVIPAILHGRSPLAVAIVGAFAVMLVTMPLSYGFGAKMIAAWIGTATSLILAAGLATAFTHLAHLSGASSDETAYLGATQSGLSLQGLLVAGMVIGALGVLVDLTVSQASTVIALRRANPSLGFNGLFRGAMYVGHDHIAATVNTLVFAYAGAALPILLIFTIGGISATDAINGEAVAEQVIATLIGSIGLILSMPITTSLAAVLALRMSDRQVRNTDDAHQHAH